VFDLSSRVALTGWYSLRGAPQPRDPRRSEQFSTAEHPAKSRRVARSENSGNATLDIVYIRVALRFVNDSVNNLEPNPSAVLGEQFEPPPQGSV